MPFTARSQDNAGDLGRAADQNESVDNDDWLYANLRTEIASYGPDRPSASVVTSDEFNSTSLNVAWTAGVVAAGSVVENSTGVIDVYDLATYPGWLAFQTDTNADTNTMTNAYVRRAYAPGTGPWSVIAKVSLTFVGATNVNQYIGIGISDDNTPTNYTNIRFGREGGTSWRVTAAHTAGALTTESCEAYASMYLGLVRESAGGTTSFWMSGDGLTWYRVTTTATAVTPGYLWIYVRQATPSPRPIYMCDWIRTFDTATLRCGEGGNS